MQHLNSLKQHYNQYFSDVEMSKKSNADVKKKRTGVDQGYGNSFRCGYHSYVRYYNRDHPVYVKKQKNEYCGISI
jgi:hypothetical protein